jgi:CDP-glucose 4,6-dehydratase
MTIDAIERAYRDRQVLVTGHSGFKGGWLTAWLGRIGARVTGVSLPPDQGPHNLFECAQIAKRCDSRFLDIRDAALVEQVVSETRPQIIFHLAAQPLVHRSYRVPIETFATNILGAAHVLEAARHCEAVQVVVFVTSDKVYENKEWVYAYRENDPLGGLDPYSASKGAAELVARSYMTVLRGTGEGFRLATARGGNVLGGGDWSEDRIVPDIARALLAGRPIVLRRPSATRPWQHVLELCGGYLTLGARLLNGLPERGRPPTDFVGSYNFGPDRSHDVAVGQLVRVALEVWGAPEYPIELGSSALHEAKYLRVDSSKAQADLGWAPRLNFDQTIRWTMGWYKRYLDSPSSAPALVDEQISDYVNLEGVRP